MNLQSHLEENQYAFYAVSATTGVISAVVTFACLRRLAKIRRVKLGMHSNDSFLMRGSSLNNNNNKLSPSIKRQLMLEENDSFRKLYSQGWPILR